MSKQELKDHLINLIQDIEDESVLEELKSIIDMVQEEQALYVLSPQQKKALDEAREDIKHGRLISNEDVEKEIDQWLNE
ncbi:MAG: hypothetical protein SFW35_07375 [Chitinophagales bacterium]|nr:hypothetical protein [Chitinophagales bacterium]